MSDLPRFTPAPPLSIEEACAAASTGASPRRVLLAVTLRGSWTP